MAKNSNPVDAHRKAMRKKELKRNKEARTKTREIITLKKDTGQLDAEVRRLTQAEQANELDAAGKARLKEVREEADRVKKAKADFVKANPDAEDLVYKREKEREKARQAERQGSSQNQVRAAPGVSIYGRRSVFYHEVLNPLGHPPPGMYDQERPGDPDELMSDASSSDSDSDIQMPEGSPTGQAGGDESDSDDSIVMPDGEAPPEARLAIPNPPSMTPLMTPAGPPMFAPMRPGFAPPQFYHGNNFRPPPQAFGTGSNHMPLPPPGFFPNQRPPYARPGFRPPQDRPNIVHNDPLSNVPHQTFQAHRQTKQGEDKAVSTDQISAASTAVPVSAVIEAAPQIRDFRKESAAFVPRAAKKKKAAMEINAAPASADTAQEESASKQNPTDTAPGLNAAPAAEVSQVPAYNPAAGGLLGKLSNILGPAKASEKPTDKPSDDYKAFLNGLSNIPQ